MEFTKITHEVLRELKKDGYNILETESTSEDDNPKFIPKFKADLWGYLESLDEEQACAVIDDLLSVEEENLKGKVMY